MIEKEKDEKEKDENEDLFELCKEGVIEPEPWLCEICPYYSYSYQFGYCTIFSEGLFY